MTAFGDAWLKDVKATPKATVRAAAGAARSGAGGVDRRGSGQPGVGRAGQRRRRRRAATGAPAASAVPGSAPARPAVTADRWSRLSVAVGVIVIIVGGRASRPVAGARPKPRSDRRSAPAGDPDLAGHARRRAPRARAS